MTITTTNNRASYSGDGSTTSFAITFPFFDDTDLEVFYINTSTGAVTDWALTTNYTVTGGSGATGTLTALVAPASGYDLLIVRSVPYKQADHFIDNDPFDATVMETALDRLTVLAQQIKENAQFVISQPSSDLTAMTALPNAAGRAGKQLVFDSNGNPVAQNSFGVWRGTWATATEYVIGDVIIDGSAGNNTSDIYTCVISHTSGTFSTDLGNGDWDKAIDAVSLGAIAGASASASLYGSSTTSLTIGTGSASLTVDASKNFNVGAPIFIVDSADSTKWMAGQVTSYNSTSGALVVNVTATGGSGTIATWRVYVSGYTQVSANPSATIVGGPAINGSATTFMRSDAAPAVALTNSSATAVSDVTMTTAGTYYNGPSLALGTGVWVVTATSTFLCPATQSDIKAKLWDGTTVFLSGEQAALANDVCMVALTAIVSNPAAAVKMSATCTNNSATMKFNQSGNSNDTKISAFRIG